MQNAISIEDQYRQRRPVLDALEQEVEFILRDAISRRGIKIANIESRVKTLESTTAKCALKDIADLAAGPSDLVGVRVVSLLRSDLEQLDQTIRSVFEVLKVDDKIRDRADSFEYMSIHYDCRMKDVYAGPRYERIAGQVFEIQIRTICMHAWAAVSHYLDYKTEQDIPLELRKELNALSGLFYVADSQFESAYRARVLSRASANRQAGTREALARPLDLDSLQAELARIYPDRGEITGQPLSEFLEELREIGITSVETLVSTLQRAKGLVLEYEKAHPPGVTKNAGKFSTLGLARTSVCMANDDYRRRTGFSDDHPMASFAKRYSEGSH